MYKYYIGKSKIVTFEDVYCIYRCRNNPENSDGEFLYNINLDVAAYKNHYMESLFLLNKLPDSNYAFKSLDTNKDYQFFSYWDAVLIKIDQ